MRKLIMLLIILIAFMFVGFPMFGSINQFETVPGLTVEAQMLPLQKIVMLSEAYYSYIGGIEAVSSAIFIQTSADLIYIYSGRQFNLIETMGMPSISRLTGMGI